MSRIRNSIDILKSSWRVLKADTELVLLPVLSGLATLVMMALFMVPLFAGADLANWEPGTADYVTLFAMYLVLARDHSAPAVVAGAGPTRLPADSPTG